MEHPTLGENPRPHVIPEAKGKAQSTSVNTSEKPNKILKMPLIFTNSEVTSDLSLKEVSAE